jgi:hypothetical protein
LPKFSRIGQAHGLLVRGAGHRHRLIAWLVRPHRCGDPRCVGSNLPET